ncbi:MAG: ABC transporter permease [Planctomycetota bacterium]
MGFLIDGVREAASLIAGGDAATLHAVWVSLLCTCTAVGLAAVVAIPYGAWLGCYQPRARVQVVVLRMGTAVPTVVIGLLIYALLSRRGFLGDMDLLYTRTAIIAGEFVLAFPMLGTLAHGIAASLDPVVVESSRTLGAGRGRALLRALGECRPALAGACLAAFGRCITELGIAVTVGGNLAMQTRTLPSTIQLELSRGDFARALAPGLILLLLACIAAIVTHRISGEARR